jgi:predicted RNA methylase
MSLAIIIFVLMITVPTLYGFLIGAPILFSPKKVIEEVSKVVEFKQGENFYDLGVGSGRSLIAADKLKLNVTGFELSPPIYWFAKFNLFISGVKKPKLYLHNFYNQDLSNADIIFCFLTPPAMEKLKPKFEKELKSGTRVVSYAFKINGWQEYRILDCIPPGKVFIYVME